MSKVLVHKGKPRNYKEYFGSMVILDKIAEAFESLGYEVQRWMSACDDPFPFDEQFEYAVIWCGQTNWYPPIKKHLKEQGTKVLYCDVDSLGDWQKEGNTDYHFILQYSIPDTPSGGVGVNVCWREFPLPDNGVEGSVKVGRGKELLVIMQEDISLRLNPSLTPWFTDCVPWVYHLLCSTSVPLLVRKHPKYIVSPLVLQMVEAFPYARWDETPTLEESMNNALAVAAIDSHAGTKAIMAGLPVLCYGQALYRRPGVSYLMDCSINRTAAVTCELKEGRCRLIRERQLAFIQGIRDRTWKVSELPGRLESYLADKDELRLGYPNE